MKIKRIAKLAFLIILFGVLPSANALNLYFDTPATNLTAGNSFTADLWISGLGDYTSPALSAFDITIGFDPSNLSFDSIVFGTGLDVFGSGDWTKVFLASDSLRIREESFDQPGDLVSHQSDSFILASITFAAIGSGNTALSIINNPLNNPLILGDENGNPLDPAPEPATVILLGIGLLGLGAGIKHRRK